VQIALMTVSNHNDQGGTSDHRHAGQPGRTPTRCCAAAARGLDEEPSRELNIEVHRMAAWRDDLLAAGSQGL
jgi:hypothetical protein